MYLVWQGPSSPKSALPPLCYGTWSHLPTEQLLIVLEKKKKKYYCLKKCHFLSATWCWNELKYRVHDFLRHFSPLLSLLFQSCLWFCCSAPDPGVQSVWVLYLCKSHCSLKVGAGKGGLIVLKAFDGSSVLLRFLLASSSLGGKCLGHLKSLPSTPCSGSEVGAAEFLWSSGAASARPESLASPPRTLAVAVFPTCVLASSSVPAHAGWGSASDNQALLSERGCKWAC